MENSRIRKVNREGTFTHFRNQKIKQTSRKGKD